MYDDYITRFRSKVAVEDNTSAKVSDFIAQSLSKMSVMLERLQKAIPVILINKDKEGGDESVMYSYTADGVQIGDYITAFEKSHLVYKQITNIKREDYIDCWKTVMCNINFTFNSTTIKGYFKGALRAAQSEEQNLSENLGVYSQIDALLMVPSSVIFNTNDSFLIQDQGWRVTAKDNITNIGITYYALEEYNIPDLTKTTIVDDPDYIPVVPTELISGVEYTFATENGFIAASTNINIIQRTATSITFTVPEVSSITITIKKDGEEVPTVYSVRS